MQCSWHKRYMSQALRKSTISEKVVYEYFDSGGLCEIRGFPILLSRSGKNVKIFPVREIK